MMTLSPKHSLLLALTVAAALPTLVACGSKDPPPANTANNAGQCPPGAPPGYPGCPAGGGVATAPPPTYAPTGPATAPPPTAPPPTAPPPATAPTAPAGIGDAADVAIKAIAAMHAPGMQPEGPRFNGSVTEGGNTTTTVSLQMGKCYTVIAVANPPVGGVMALQAELLAPLTQAQVESQSGASPNGAVLGAGAKCISPLIPAPVPYTVRVTSKRGAGAVAVQLYSKIK